MRMGEKDKKEGVSKYEKLDVNLQGGEGRFPGQWSLWEGFYPVWSYIQKEKPKFIISTLSSPIPYAIALKESLNCLNLGVQPKFLTVDSHDLSDKAVSNMASKLKKYGIKSDDNILIFDEHGRGDFFPVPQDYVFDKNKQNVLRAPDPSDNCGFRNYGTLSRSSSIIRSAINSLNLKNKVIAHAIPLRRLGPFCGTGGAYTFWRKNYNFNDESQKRYLTPSTLEEALIVKKNHEDIKVKTREYLQNIHSKYLPPNCEKEEPKVHKENTIKLQNILNAFLFIGGFSVFTVILGANFTGNAIANLSDTTSNFIGAGLFLVAVLAGLFWMKRRK